MVTSNNVKQFLFVLSGTEGPEEFARVKQLTESDNVNASWIAPENFRTLLPVGGQCISVPTFFSAGIRFWLYYPLVVNFFVARHLLRQRSAKLLLFQSGLCLALFPTVLIFRNSSYIFLMRVPWGKRKLRQGNWIIDSLVYLINCLGLLAAEKVIVTTYQMRSAILKEASFLGGRLAVLPLSLCRQGSLPERAKSALENQIDKAARFYERRERVSDDKLKLIQEFSLTEKSFVVTTFSEFLNLDVVSRLLHALSDSGDERLCLIIVGKGPEKSNAQALALGLGLDQRVVFVVGDSVPDRLFHGADLYFATSQALVMSDNLMKGLSAGISLIAIDNIESRELLEFEELLVKNDAEMISQRLIELQRNREELRLVRARCETIAKKYDFNWSLRASELVST